MIKPRKNEGEKTFVLRCMESASGKEEFPDPLQRAERCHGIYLNKDKTKADKG